MCEPNKIIIIAAIGKNRELGYQGQLIWKIKEDMKHFRETTQGQTVVMGRKTWDSIGGKPLSGRICIIVSKTLRESLYENVSIVDDVRKIPGSYYVIGGAEIYAESLQFATDMILTHIISETPVVADTYFPEWNSDVWEIVGEKQLTDKAHVIYYRKIKPIIDL